MRFGAVVLKFLFVVLMLLSSHPVLAGPPKELTEFLGMFMGAPLTPQQASEVQKHLVKLGLYSGEIDGEVGPDTMKGIKSFQQSLGNPPTGHLTKAQRKALRRQAELQTTNATTAEETLASPSNDAGRSSAATDALPDEPKSFAQNSYDDWARRTQRRKRESQELRERGYEQRAAELDQAINAWVSQHPEFVGEEATRRIGLCKMQYTHLRDPVDGTVTCLQREYSSFMKEREEEAKVAKAAEQAQETARQALAARIADTEANAQKYLAESGTRWEVEVARDEMYERDEKIAKSFQDTETLRVIPFAQCHKDGSPGAGLFIRVLPMDEAQSESFALGNTVAGEDKRSGVLGLVKVTMKTNSDVPRAVMMPVVQFSNNFLVTTLLKEGQELPKNNEFQAFNNFMSAFAAGYAYGAELHPAYVKVNELWRILVEFSTTHGKALVKFPLHAPEILDVLETCK